VAKAPATASATSANPREVVGGVVQEVAEEEAVVVRAVCEACSLDMKEEGGRDHPLKRQADREVKPGNKWPEGFA
jgi:hypothetical protein